MPNGVLHIILDTTVYSAIGLVSGLHSACWGAYKDSPYEGFSIKKMCRSLLIGFVAGTGLVWLFPTLHLNYPNYGLYFAYIVAIERIVTEFHKEFIRIESQEKYIIPQRFSVLGRIVLDPQLRLLIGFGVAASIFMLFLLPTLIQFKALPQFIKGVLWGEVAGLFVSISGAWKDAPIEGFRPTIFLRSLLVAGIWGIVFSFLTDNFPLLLVSCIGAERITVEFYKGFLKKTIPGKFKTTIVHYPEWIVRRRILILPYIITWITFIGLLLK